MARRPADSDLDDDSPSITEVRLYAESKVNRESLKTLTQRLYGNGQPGDIQSLQAKVANLERVYYKIGGVVTATMVISKVLLDWVVPKLLEGVIHAVK